MVIHTNCTVCCRRIKSWHTCSSRCTFFCHCTLRSEFQGQFSRQVHLLESFVLSYEGSYHFTDLPCLQHLTYFWSARVFFSRLFILPKPTPGMPALLETTVKSFKSNLSLKALINELGTPLKPKPPTSRVLLLFMSLIASWADAQILLICLLDTEEENCRRAT